MTSLGRGSCTSCTACGTPALTCGRLAPVEELQEYFFTIVEHAAHEANRAKISRWSSSAIHLATDFQEFPFKDNFIRTLVDLTEFDLTVLAMIYSTSFDRKSELGSVVKDYFEHCDVGRPITSQAIKRLASHALIEEQGSASRLAASGPFSYALNELGSTFLRFVSTDYGAVADASDVPGVQYARISRSGTSLALR